MSIPTLEQFNETIAALLNFNGSELITDVELITCKGKRIPELDEIVRIISKREEILHEKYLNIKPLLAWNWLESQSSYISALEKKGGGENRRRYLLTRKMLP